MLAPATFTEPVGTYAPHLWPLTDAERADGLTEADKLEVLLGTWITAAEGLHPGDEATQALYVTARADASVYARLFSAPSTAAVQGEASYSYSSAQLAEWKRRADASGAAYALALAPPAAAPTGYAVIRTNR